METAGYCQKGDACTFAHSAEELASARGGPRCIQSVRTGQAWQYRPTCSRQGLRFGACMGRPSALQALAADSSQASCHGRCAFWLVCMSLRSAWRHLHGVPWLLPEGRVLHICPQLGGASGLISHRLTMGWHARNCASDGHGRNAASYGDGRHPTTYGNGRDGWSPATYGDVCNPATSFRPRSLGRLGPELC